MSESRFRGAYQAAGKRHDETRTGALEALAEAGRRVDAWERERTGLEDRLGRQLAHLWKEELGLRPFPRWRRKLPIMPRQRVDRRLRRLRRKRLGGYRKKLRRFRDAARASWPARRMRFAAACMALRLRVSPGWALFVLAALALVLLDALAPSVLEGFFAVFVSGGSGP